MALNSTQDFPKSSSAVGAQAEAHEGRLDSQAHSSYLLHCHTTDSPRTNLTSRLQRRQDEPPCQEHPPSVVHVSSQRALTDSIKDGNANQDAVPVLNRASSASSDRSSTQPQLQQQHTPLAQKRPSSDVLHANLYEELRQQHKHAKHAYLRMHQHAHAVCLHKSPKPKHGRARRASAGSAPLHNDCSPAAFTPGLGSSPVEYGSALLLPPSALQLQHSHQQQQQQKQQQPEPAVQEPHAAASPDLPSLTVVVKLLLQLAAAQAGPDAADTLRQQLLQQVRGMAAAATNVGQPYRVAAALQQALPGLQTAVIQACSQANGHVDSTAKAAAAFAGEVDAAALVAKGWQNDAAVPEQGSSPGCATAACNSSDGNAAAASGIAAIETALLEAACEVQLESLCIGRADDQVPAAADAQGSGTSCSSTFDLDFDQLLQSELAAAMADDYSI